MATATVIAAIGIAASAGSTIVQARESKRQAAITGARSREAAAASERAEAARRKQARLSADRARRKAIRERLIASAQGINAAVSSGIDLQSSPVQGGQAEITQSGFFELGSIEQSEQLGEDIFDANADIADASSALNIETAASQSRVATAQGVGSVGQTLFKNSERIGKISQSLFGVDDTIGINATGSAGLGASS